MADFDRIARAYRWLEYCTFGPRLEQCRGLHLPRMLEARHVLVLGDGDGRFTAALLERHRQVRVVAVDNSAAMLRLLSERVRALKASARLAIVCEEAVGLLEGSSRRTLQDSLALPPVAFDYVCSHFFLDCLSTEEVQRLIDGVCPRLSPGALWIVSEFAAPSLWTRAVVAVLYSGFALLAGLQTQELPAWREVFLSRGFQCVAEERRLAGLLTSIVWRWTGHQG